MSWIALLLASLLYPSLSLSAEPNDSSYQEVEIDGSGAIVGRVYFEDDYPKADRQTVNIDADTCGLRVTSRRFVVDPDSKGLAYAVLMIRDIHAGKPFAEAQAAIEQIKCRYEPHVTFMWAGENLNIKNQDPLLHNVHAYRGKRSLFNLAQPKAGHETSKQMAQEGLVTLQCDVHNWMKGYVVVVSNPYIAITDAQGSFTITDVPPGEYEVTLWHEVMGTTTKTVKVERGAEAELDFSIGG